MHRLCARPAARTAFAVVAGISLLAAAGPSRGQVVRNDFWSPNGTTDAVAYANGTVYVGGLFTQVAPVTGSFVGLDGTTGRALEPRYQVDGLVDAIAGDGTGGWYIGGQFQHVLGQPRANLAHVDASGALSAWNPGTNGPVNALGVDGTGGGKIYVGGNFTVLGGGGRDGLGAVDAASGALLPWHPSLRAGVGDPLVTALAVHGATLYVGGYFDQADGLPKSNLAAIDTSGTVQSWMPYANGAVQALAVYSLVRSPFTLTIFAGGEFPTGVQGQVNGILAFDGYSGNPASWLGTVDYGSVRAIALSTVLSTVTVWVGGAFPQADGQPRANLAAFDLSGNLKAWNPGSDGGIAALMYAGGTLYAGGTFQTIGGHKRSHLAQIDVNGNALPWSPEPDADVLALGTGNGIFAGGDFSVAGGVPRRSLAALDAVTGLPTGWNPDVVGGVQALLVDGANVYAAGTFDSAGALPRHDLACIDAASGAPTAWNPSPDAPVTALALDGGALDVGGSFTHVGGATRSGLARLSTSTGAADVNWNPNPQPGVVHALAVAGGLVYTGGTFSDIGHATRHALAALDAGGNATAWNPTALDDANLKPVGDVTGLAVSGKTLFAIGPFIELAGRPRTGFGAVDTDSGYATLLDPYTDSGVHALALAGPTLWVGGDFLHLGGYARPGIGTVDLASSTIGAWSPLEGGYVTCLAAGDGSVFAGGYFNRTLGPHARLLALSTAVTGVEPPGGPGGGPPAALRVAPNPARADMALRFVATEAGPVRVDVFDVAGRHVRALAAQALAPGEQALTWDGRDAGGRPVPPGVYMVQVRTAGRVITGRAVRLD